MPGLWAGVASFLAGALVLVMWRPPPLARLGSGAAPWLLSMPAWLRPRPDAMPARRRWWVGAGCGIGAYGWGSSLPWYVAIPLGVIVAGAATWGLGRIEPTSSVRRRERLVAQLPQALRLIAACLSAGLPLRSAVGAVSQSLGGEVGAELDRVHAQIKVGVSEPDAWLSLKDHAVLGPLARDLARAVESGTAVHGVLQQRADEIQSDHRAAVEIRAKSVGVRTVLPLSLCFLPAFFLIGVVPIVAGMVLPTLTP